MHAAAAAERGEVSFWHPASGGSGLSGIKQTHSNFGRLEKETSQRGGSLVESKVYAAPLHVLIQLASC